MVSTRAFALATAISIIQSVYGAAVNPHPWIAPGPGDVRSPCPGLNSLANHGFLPRSGKNLTVAMLNKALLDGMNVSPDFSTVIGGFGELSSTHPLTLSYDLDNLDLHNLIEHDGSLSRNDLAFGDNHSFDNDKWQEVLAFVQGQENFNISSGAKARYHRITEQKALNPTFTYTPLQFILSYGETALYLSVMGDPVTGVAPVSYVRQFFEQERLPYELGWTKPKVPTSLASLAVMILELNAATGEPLPEGLTITESTVKAAFRGVTSLL